MYSFLSLRTSALSLRHMEDSSRVLRLTVVPGGLIHVWFLRLFPALRFWQDGVQDDIPWDVRDSAGARELGTASASPPWLWPVVDPGWATSDPVKLSSLSPSQGSSVMNNVMGGKAMPLEDSFPEWCQRWQHQVWTPSCNDISVVCWRGHVRRSGF